METVRLDFNSLKTQSKPMCIHSRMKNIQNSLNLDFNLYIYMHSTQGTVKSLRVKHLKLAKILSRVDSNYIKTNCFNFRIFYFLSLLSTRVFNQYWKVDGYY